MKTISFELNGRVVDIAVHPGETLLDMLRERLGLTGAKKGCEVGECGACTILVDDVPLNSCLLLAEQVDKKRVLTIEGLSDGQNLHPIQQAFVDEGAVQCGFCTPGMVLSAYALIKKYPEPTEAQIKQGMAGNLCRCGAYLQIMKAIQAAAEKMLPET